MLRTLIFLDFGASERPLAGKVNGLLAPQAKVFGSRLEIRAKRIDVESTAAIVASMYRQIFRATTRFDIEKHSLDAGLVKIIVVAE